MRANLMLACLIVVFVSAVAAPSADCLELVGRWPYGPAYAVAASGDYAYFGSGTALMVANISNPAAPQVVGDVTLPGVVYSVAVSGEYAYMATYDAGLRVIDVSIPSAPVEVGYVATPGEAWGVAVSGDYAYMATYDAGLRVIDVSIPSAPVEVGYVATPGFARSVAVSGGYGYVADTSTRLRVIDVSVASAPVEVGFVRTPGLAFGVAVSGGYAYVANREAGLRVLDVSVASAPVEVGFVDTPAYAEGVAVAGGYAYVAGRYDGLRVLDVSVASAPVEVGFVGPRRTADTLGVAVSGGYAYFADNTAGLRVIDVSVASAPVEVGFVDTPGWAEGVAVSGGYAYVADHDRGLRVIDVSVASAPVEVGFVEMPGWATAVAVSGAYAYVAAGGLAVIDVSVASAPVEVGFVEMPGIAHGVAVSGGYAYVADGWAGLRVIDVSIPSAPVEVGFVDTPGEAEGVAVSGDYAYVGDSHEGLRVIDVSIPSAPVEVGFVRTPGLAFGVAVSGGHVYLADQDAGLAVFADTAPPSVSNTTVTPSSGYPSTMFLIQSTVTDESGVESVTAMIRKVEGGYVQELPMTPAGGDEYAATFDSTAAPSGAYVVDILAVDSSPYANQQTVTAVAGFDVDLPLPGAFGKVAPADGATGQPIDLTLSWGESTHAASYEYCIDATANSTCDGMWTSVGAGTSTNITGLDYETTYSWQVRAVNTSGSTQANGGTWWTFTTLPLPGAFSKLTPADGATNQPASLTLTWGTSADASSYEYCVDLTNNNACDGSWTTVGSGTSAVLSGLSWVTTYWWQVRAVNAQGSTQANNGAWWHFTTENQPLPGAFSKLTPADGATGQPVSLSLTWGTSTDAASYECCIDTTDNNACDSLWFSVGLVTSTEVTGLTEWTAYYWQVRAVNTTGSTDADGGTWWSFVTTPYLFGDSFESGDTSRWSATVP